jgi:molecular chaperone GrpE (heat shock protein)
MARGWESKSVESQIEDADLSADRGESFSPEQREIQRKRASLELSRRRVLQEIEETRSAIRRTALERTLAFLDEEIGKLRELPSEA